MREGHLLQNELLFHKRQICHRARRTVKERNGESIVDELLQKEVAEAGMRLREAISRVVQEAPECFDHKDGEWSVEFRNPHSGEKIIVTYSGPTILMTPARVN